MKETAEKTTNDVGVINGKIDPNRVFDISTRVTETDVIRRHLNALLPINNIDLKSSIIGITHLKSERQFTISYLVEGQVQFLIERFTLRIRSNHRWLELKDSTPWARRNFGKSVLNSQASSQA